jgi:hypothetical protein
VKSINIIQKLEDLVREGRFDEVKILLREIKLIKIPRKQALRLANIAMRIGIMKRHLTRKSNMPTPSVKRETGRARL